jgi:hypothetical protein
MLDQVGNKRLGVLIESNHGFYMGGCFFASLDRLRYRDLDLGWFCQ